MDTTLNPQAPQQAQQTMPTQGQLMQRQMLLEALSKQQQNGAPPMTAGAGVGNALAQGLTGYMQGRNMAMMGRKPLGALDTGMIPLPPTA
jgi:hypothetical protein